MIHESFRRSLLLCRHFCGRKSPEKSASFNSKNIVHIVVSGVSQMEDPDGILIHAVDTDILADEQRAKAVSPQ